MASQRTPFQVQESDVRVLFEFLDVEKIGRISFSNVAAQLAPLFREMNSKDFRFLMGDKKELTIDDLRAILLDQPIYDVDPVAEAFRVYDPHRTGFIDTSILQKILEQFGLPRLNQIDQNLLLQIADMDKDGKISLPDFKSFIEQCQREQLAAAQATADI